MIDWLIDRIWLCLPQSRIYLENALYVLAKEEQETGLKKLSCPLFFLYFFISQNMSTSLCIDTMVFWIQRKNANWLMPFIQELQCADLNRAQKFELDDYQPRKEVEHVIQVKLSRVVDGYCTFLISALCVHHDLHSRPKAAADVMDVVPGYGGPLHLPLGLHGKKVHVGGGTSSGLDIASSTTVQRPVVWTWYRYRVNQNFCENKFKGL